MGRRKVKFVLPRLNDCGGDLSFKAKWYIEYSYRDNRIDKLERYRIYDGFNALKSSEERYAHAESIINDIRSKILSGWTPFDHEIMTINNYIAYDIQSKVYGNREDTGKNLFFYISAFLEDKAPYLAKKSLQDYTSKLRLLYQWLLSEGKGNIFAQEVDNDLISAYVLFMIKEKKLEKRTVNDSKQRISQLLNWLVRKKVLVKNPLFDLPIPKQHADHSAQPMSKQEASTLLNYIKKHDKQLFLFCATMFYCAIRPGKELRLLKIKDINILAETIKIRSENAKTNEGIVNMPPPLIKILESMKITGNNREFYVFGKEGKPGLIPWGINYFRLRFIKYRDELGYPDEYKLYSWKCTGAILFAASGAPLSAVRDHCRHKSTAYTDIYLSKKIGKENDYVKHKFPKL